MSRAAAVLGCGVLLVGCYASHERGGSSADGGGRDSGCVLIAPGDAGTLRPELVDLLIMVDNSNSMSEEQASLGLALPNLIRAISAGDADLDGTRDFAPVESLHVGVVTGDMGTGGFTVPTCANSDFGDDGVLRTAGNPGSPTCEVAYPTFLVFRPGAGDEPETFAATASCVTTAGTGGCGFEQQLEAVLKAVTPSTSALRFHDRTRGNADQENAGFLRADSVLAVLLVTDENDCSAADPDVLNPRSEVYTADLNLRCFEHSEALHPVERYVDGLLAIRSAQPGRLVFASIVGVPPELSGQSEDLILADPRIEERVDRFNPTNLLPSCDVPGRGLAFPPRRILQTSRGLRAAGARAVVLSICVDDFSPAVRLILDEIAAAATPICR